MSQTDLRPVTHVPGFFKIFDEILVNAADNKVNDATMSTIKVNIDREKGVISVMNDGRGIPVEMHKKENVMIPELIFGHLYVRQLNVLTPALPEVTSMTTKRS